MSRFSRSLILAAAAGAPFVLFLPRRMPGIGVRSKVRFVYDGFARLSVAATIKVDKDLAVCGKMPLLSEDLVVDPAGKRHRERGRLGPQQSEVRTRSIRQAAADRQGRARQYGLPRHRT